uniref:maternal B9.15 protein-like n=1 Tax=Myxine glutinosa TaxID=7769 RepID=UPI0035902E3E
MWEEIAAAVFFVSRLLRRGDTFPVTLVAAFITELTARLLGKYRPHWYPDHPSRGQAFRCLRISTSQPVEPLFLDVCHSVNIPYSLLGLPQELTIWVDPGEVSCRYAERSCPFSVARFPDATSGLSASVSSAVDRATSDYHSGSSACSSICSSSASDDTDFDTDKEGAELVSYPIPTIFNPNSVYQKQTCQNENPRPALSAPNQLGGRWRRKDRFHWVSNMATTVPFCSKSRACAAKYTPQAGVKVVDFVHHSQLMHPSH